MPNFDILIDTDANIRKHIHSPCLLITYLKLQQHQTLVLMTGPQSLKVINLKLISWQSFSGVQFHEETHAECSGSTRKLQSAKFPL